MSLVAISRRLAREVDGLRFGPPVAYVYNPLVYARGPHEAYLRRFGRKGREVLLLGMNPGPFGMAQTGVPFGDVTCVRDWMGLAGRVEAPAREHPRRPVQGFDCPRGEVSGQRLWGWARRRFGSAETFFARMFVWNVCPLVFLEESGRNRTPDKLPASERKVLLAICDRAIEHLVDWLQPRLVVGIGAFAETRARAVLADRAVPVGRILHPSPASPAANRGWAAQAERELAALGVDLPQ